MARIKATLLLVLLVALGRNLAAQTSITAAALPRYPLIKTRFDKSLSAPLADEELLDVFRQSVTQGRYSGRPMLRRMFGNLMPGSFNLPPRTPGLAATVRLLASDNANVVTGNARTLRYAMSLGRDARFDVIGLNRLRTNSVGVTDADIVFRHRATGLRGRMEVKNMTPASQRANWDKTQNQILKMAEDARVTGEVQVWANRQDVLPEVRTFAKRHGVAVAERLRTGSANLRPEDLGFNQFATSLDAQFRLQAGLTALAGGVQLGMGVYLASQGISELETDFSDFGNTDHDWLRVGEHGSTALAGGGFSLAGAAQLARQIPSLANASRLISLTKWGGRIGMTATVLVEVFFVSEYLRGDLTDRQFWRGQASLAGGLVGGTAGALLGLKSGALTGGLIGSFFGPPGTAIGAGIGGTIGAIAGGFGGGYAGSYYAAQGMETFYRLKDTDQQEKYAQFLLFHYQGH